MVFIFGLFALLVALASGSVVVDGRQQVDPVVGAEDETVVASYNVRTASQWANRDGGDQANQRTWGTRKMAVAKSVLISGASVVGSQEGLAWQLDELLGLLGPTWRRAGGGRFGDGGDEDELAAVLYDAKRVELVGTGDFWLSEQPEVRGSKGWGASLPRVATWARFFQPSSGPSVGPAEPTAAAQAAEAAQPTGTTASGRGGRWGREFVVLNAHVDHASDRARVESAKLLRARAAELLSGAALAAPDQTVVFLTGDFNAVKTEGGEWGWYAALTSTTGADSSSGGEAAAGGGRHLSPSALVAPEASLAVEDAWAVAPERGCGSAACGQATYHAWRGSAEPSANWRRPFDGPKGVALALSGERHIDAVFVVFSVRAVSGARTAARPGKVTKARVITDDKRRRVFGGPFASDHYPVVATFRWDPATSRGVTKLASAESTTPRGGPPVVAPDL